MSSRLVRLASSASRSLSTMSAAPARAPPRRVGATPIPEAFAARMNTPEQDLAEYHKMQRRNAALGITLTLFVCGIWYYSVSAVSAAKDAFTTPEVQQIEQELDREERAEKAKQQQK